MPEDHEAKMANVEVNKAPGLSSNKTRNSVRHKMVVNYHKRIQETKEKISSLILTPTPNIPKFQPQNMEFCPGDE